MSKMFTPYRSKRAEVPSQKCQSATNSPSAKRASFSMFGYFRKKGKHTQRPSTNGVELVEGVARDRALSVNDQASDASEWEHVDAGDAASAQHALSEVNALERRTATLSGLVSEAFY